MFAPTADQRNTVKIMAGLGVPQDKICLSVVNAAAGKPVSEPTLRRAFRREIDSGQTELIRSVACRHAARGDSDQGPALSDMPALQGHHFELAHAAKHVGEIDQLQEAHG